MGPTSYCHMVSEQNNTYLTFDTLIQMSSIHDYKSSHYHSEWHKQAAHHLNRTNSFLLMSINSCRRPQIRSAESQRLG